MVNSFTLRNKTFGVCLVFVRSRSNRKIWFKEIRIWSAFEFLFEIAALNGLHVHAPWMTSSSWFDHCYLCNGHDTSFSWNILWIEAKLFSIDSWMSWEKSATNTQRNVAEEKKNREKNSLVLQSASRIAFDRKLSWNYDIANAKRLGMDTIHLR